jgi:hypothetical protein
MTVGKWKKYWFYMPLKRDSFVWEVNDISTDIFEAYLLEFSTHNARDYKIVVVDNAGLHSTKI